MKENPYFKFRSDDWLNGRISLESFELQGLFVSICAYYWHHSGQLTRTMAEKRFKNQIGLQSLLNENLIGLNGDKLEIRFLDEQLDARGIRSATNTQNGKKGGRPKSTNTAQKTESVISENPNKTNIKEEGDKEEDKDKKKNKRDNGFQPDFDSLPSWMVEPLKVWMEYRRQLKKKYVPAGWELLIKKIEADYQSESELMEAVQHSIANGWTGLFKPKQKMAQTTPLTEELKEPNWDATF